MEILLNVSNKFFAVIKQIGFIILYFMMIIAIQSPLIKDLNSTNLFIANISSIFAEILVSTIFILIFRKTLIPDFYDFKNNGKKYIQNNYKYWIMGLGIMFISNIILNHYIGIPVNEEINQNVLNVMPVYATITMVIIAPIVEELLTRVILKKHFNIYIYSLLSGLIFGSLHLLSITSPIEMLYIIPYGVLGFFFAFMYSKSNNIWTNITFHSLHNFIALMLFFTGV